MKHLPIIQILHWGYGSVEVSGICILVLVEIFEGITFFLIDLSFLGGEECFYLPPSLCEYLVSFFNHFQFNFILLLVYYLKECPRNCTSEREIIRNCSVFRNRNNKRKEIMFEKYLNKYVLAVWSLWQMCWKSRDTFFPLYTVSMLV